MNKFKLILKGIMLWITAFVTMFFISGVDSIYNNGYFESQTGEPLFLPSINPLSILLLFMVNCQGKMGHMEQNHATM